MPSRKAIRDDDKRLAKNHPNVKRKPKSRMQALVDGDITVEDLDQEEIMRGQVKAKDGTFRGRPTDFIPRKLADALRAEMMRRWQAEIDKELIPSLNALKEIRDNKRLPADARYKSAVHLIERSAGKVAEKSEMKLEVSKWEQDIEGLLFEGDK